MATIITRGLIGEEDLSVQNSSTDTFSRTTSSGGSQSLTKIARSTLCTREFDVTQFGAVGNGTTNDTAAIQAAVTSATAAGGGMVVFPAGYTFLMKPTAADTPIITLGIGGLTFWMYGATIKIDATAATDATSATNEMYTGWAFKATGYDNLSFLGGTFDGNKDVAGGYNRFGLLCGIQCDHVLIRDVTFLRSGNKYGFLYASAYDGTSTKAHFTDWKITGNYFGYAHAAFWLEESMSGITVSDNTLEWLTLTDSTDFYGDTLYARGIRFTGFVDTTAAFEGAIHDITITNNKIRGAWNPIEFWNEYTSAGPGTPNDPQYAYRISMSGNTIWAVWGCSINTACRSSVTNNTITRIVAADVDTYLGDKVSATTANWVSNDLSSYAIEITPGYEMSVVGNRIDGGYIFSTHGSFGSGILTGRYGDSGVYSQANNVIADNTIMRCYYGIDVDQCDYLTIKNNKISGCLYAVVTFWTLGTANSGVTWIGNRLSGNEIRGDSAANGHGGINADAVVKLEGSWTIDGNTFYGQSTMATGEALLLCRGFDTNANNIADVGTFIITGNRFLTWETKAINFSGTAATMPLSLVLDGNVFSSGTNAPGTGVRAISITRKATGTTVSIAMGTNYAIGCEHAVRFSGTPTATETYDLGAWKKDTTMTRLWRHENGADLTDGMAYGGFTATITAATPMMVKNIQVSMVGGASTVRATDVIPANSIIHGVTILCDTIVAGTALTTYSVGHAIRSSGAVLAANVWGANIALAANTVTTPASRDLFGPTYSDMSGRNFVFTGTTAQDLIFTAAAGVFDSGMITAQILYSTMTGQVF